MKKRSVARRRAIRTVTMKLSPLLLALFAAAGPALAQLPESSSVRALRQVYQSEKTQVQQLVANTGWQPLYTQKIEVKKGDLLRLVGGAQLTLDSTSVIGQQMRLTVNGQQVGGQPAEINTQPGAHHLPLMVTALYQASEDGEVVVALEGSAFHSDGNFPLVVDHQGELATGALLVEAYRTYTDLQAAWDDHALLLNDVHHPSSQQAPLWGVAPFVQQALATQKLPVNSGDILRPSAQAVAYPTAGLEQFTGVLTSGDRAVSFYGGQNAIDPENPMAPMWLEGFQKADSDGHLLLEHRLYGAFGRGFSLVPDTARFEVAHFASYGRALQDFSQTSISAGDFLANGSSVELWSREVDLKEGDLLKATASFQLGPPGIPVPVDCRLILEIEGPGKTEQSMSGKSLSGVKSMVGLSSFVTAQAATDGTYRVSAKLNGISPAGPTVVRLDANHSQVQRLHFSMPGSVESSSPSAFAFP